MAGRQAVARQLRPVRGDDDALVLVRLPDMSRCRAAAAGTLW
jgi:hypothetical protein